MSRHIVRVSLLLLVTWAVVAQLGAALAESAAGSVFG